MKRTALICAVVLFISLFAPLSWAVDAFGYSSVPAYSGKPYVSVHDSKPYFSVDGLKPVSYETYGELDYLKRCTVANACIGTDLMPTEERTSIGSVTPTGWHSDTYSIVDGGYLYNRCHLIGWQLTAENANKKNLITGTRYLNTKGMLPFENMTADYIKETHNHVQYRVTPVFQGTELVARGVLMEAYSIEDQGEGIEFCVFCYNVQPGITINYQTGESSLTGAAQQKATVTLTESVTFVLNINSRVYHVSTCSSVSRMSEKNKQSTTKTAAQIEKEGFTPCNTCKPQTAGNQIKTYDVGDIDRDGSITAADARLALRKSVGLESFSRNMLILGDADFDSSVTAADARLILRAAVGLQIIIAKSA